VLRPTYVSQPFTYRLPGDIPVIGFPLSSYNPYLTTAPRIYGEAATGSESALFVNAEDLADGYGVIWLGTVLDQVHWPSYEYRFYRFNGTTGAYLGAVEVDNVLNWFELAAVQSRDGSIYALQQTTLLAYPVQADPVAGVSVSADVAFDLGALTGATEIEAFLIDADLNLLLVGKDLDPNLRTYNLTTGVPLQVIALPGFPVTIMPVDTRQCYVMTDGGLLCLVDFQAGTIVSVFTVQTGFNAFSAYRTITYDRTYARFLSWVLTPPDGTGQNTSVVRGYYPVPQAVGLTKPVPLRAPRKYRTVPVLTRVYGDAAESIGGGVVSFAVPESTVGAITSFPGITDADAEAVGQLSGVDSGNATVLASITLETTAGTDLTPLPPPLPTLTRNPGDFPRLAGFIPGATANLDNPTFQAQVAKLDLAVVAFPPGYVGGAGQTAQQICLAIKALNPNIVLVNYTDPFEHPPAYNASSYGGVTSMVENPQGLTATAPNRPQWYVFDHAQTGANPNAVPIASPWAGGSDLINFTAWGRPRNLAGQDYNAWRANFDSLYSTRAALTLDGMFVDHTPFTWSTLVGPVPSLAAGTYDGVVIGSTVDYLGSINGDWNINELPAFNGHWPPPDTGPPYSHQDSHFKPSPANTPDLASTVDTAARVGVAAFAAQLRTNMGAGKYVLANCKDWDVGLLGPYFNMANGGLLESIIGQADSYETVDFATMQTAYRNIMVALANPKLAIFAQDGNLTDYQDVRYGLTACLIGTGFGTAYYYHSDGASVGGYAGVNWFDEFDFNLGAPTQTVTVPWQNGVYRRDFQHGIVLCNPKGNGSQTVTLETSYTKLTGSQDPTTNDGSTVTSVTLADRDGLILMA
jgi:hypothetical protein